MKDTKYVVVLTSLFEPWYHSTVGPFDTIDEAEKFITYDGMEPETRYQICDLNSPEEWEEMQEAEWDSEELDLDGTETDKGNSAQ